MALIHLDRATELLPNFDTADNGTMQDIVNAASDTIERYCNRVFAATAYDELIDGTGDCNIFVNNFPIIQIDRIAWNTANVIQVRNTDTGVSRASFRMTADSSTPPKPGTLVLVSVKNGTTTTRTINLTTTATMADLATAINAYSADGWAASALGVYSTWSVADLYPLQGARECRWYGAAYLELHAWSLPQFDFRPESGEIVSPFGFGRGYRNIRVLYTGGFATIPEPIQQACAALACAVFNSRNVNANLQSENLGGYSYSRLAEQTFHNLDLVSRYGLALYKSYRVPKFRI